MRIPYNKEWFILEKEDYANYLFVVINWEGFTYYQTKWGFPSIDYLLAEYVNSACYLITTKDSYDKVNDYNYKMLFNKPEVWDKMHKNSEIFSTKLFKYASKIKKIDAASLSNKQLLKIVNQFLKFQMDSHITRGPMWFLETPNNPVSTYLRNYLEELYKENKKIKIKPYEAFQILSAPLKKSMWTKEHIELAKIALIKDKNDQSKKLASHAKKYEWIEYGLQGKILDFKYFKNELNKIKRQKVDRYLKKVLNDINLTRPRQSNVYNLYKIGPTHRRIFKIVQDSLFTRLYSKDCQFYGYYCMEHILKEIGKRGGLTLEQVRFLSPEDFTKILLKGKNFSKVTASRQKYSLHLSHNGKTDFWHGSEAKAIRKKLKYYKEKLQSHSGNIIKGQPAYDGKAKGRVKIVNTIQEMAKMHQGNILVSHMTNPSIVPAMKKARAIVTDLGGITCHAAIVARELKKPCIIGTKVVTQVLRDGDMVEVDATKGIVKKL